MAAARNRRTIALDEDVVGKLGCEAWREARGGEGGNVLHIRLLRIGGGASATLRELEEILRSEV